MMVQLNYTNGVGQKILCTPSGEWVSGAKHCKIQGSKK